MSTVELAPIQAGDMAAEQAIIHKSAACRGVDPNLFHPKDTVYRENGAVVVNPQILVAKAMCDACSVRERCRNYAENTAGTDIQAGLRIYGGKLYGVKRSHRHRELLARHIELG